MPSISDTFALAHQYHQAGALPQAEYLYRQILEADPRHADAWCFLAAAFQGQGKSLEAMDAYRNALQLNPNYVEAHNNLGNTFLSLGKVEEAIAEFQKALQLRPTFALAHNNIALAYERKRSLDEAIVHYREALRLQPDFPEVLCNLGNAIQSQGKLDEAIELYRKALQFRPEYPECLNNLANAYRNQWKLDEAITCYRRALQIRPNFPEALCNMGATMEPQGQLDEAIQCYQQALRMRPNYAEAHNNTGVALMAQGRLDKAAESFRQAIRLRPDLGSAHSSYLLCVNYDPEADLDAVFAEHVRWGRLHTPTTSPAPFENDRDPERKLRVGYVSPDLRFHALTRYFEPVLAHHDPSQVEVYCYAEVVHPDEVTLRLKEHAHGWRSTCGLSDVQVAEMIRADGIDILVDLAGHTAGTRLRIFGLKPAPVQASWLGYLNTTGLATVDYRITDEILDPSGESTLGTEELVRLPHGFCCFAPPKNAPALSPLPALTRGYLTFGSLHNLFKLNAQVFDLWSRLLRALPKARLLMFRDTLSGTARERIVQEFVQRGIEAERLDFRRAADVRTYMDIYEEIDVCLDVFPWSGGVITCESLWMGVPVMSLRGTRTAGRNAAALLTRIGIKDWVANTPEQFVACGKQLASNLDQLARLRESMRERMSNTICDARRCTRELEDAFRMIWRRWCATPAKSLSKLSVAVEQELNQINERGIQFAQQGRIEESKAEFQRALSIQPDHVNSRVNLGLAFVRQGRYNEAIKQYQEGLRSHPDHVESHFHLGFAFQRQERHEDAVTCYRNALRHRPDYVEARNNLGIALMEQGKLDEALKCYRTALKLQPDHVDAHTNMAIVLMEQNQLDQAAAGFRKALALNSNIADAHSGLGVVLTNQGKLNEALACFERALACDPRHADAHLNRAIIWLMRGHWLAAWPEYEWRWQTKTVPRLRFDKPRWDGSPLAGKTILLASEQGLGDALQFLRYVPFVQERGGKVIVQCQPALQRLLASCLGQEMVSVGGAELPKFDVYAPLMSLPGIFGTTPVNVPARVQYLRADERLAEHWKNELSALEGFKIGVAWQGSPKNRNDRRRSFPLASLAPVAAVPGVQLVSLQKGPGAEQIQALGNEVRVIDLGSRLDESNGAFMDTAAVMMNLDLVITADTAVAHLAGALGVPIWLALPFAPDWRWLLQREDTPWYPTMRLFRQTRLGNWQDVFDAMAKKLRSMAEIRR